MATESGSQGGRRQGRAFVIRPFGEKMDRAGAIINFERVGSELIGPAIDANGLTGDTTVEVVDAGNIRDDMFGLILEADIVICDVTVHNANVFYELGIRHALRRRGTILVKGRPTADAIPFDLLTDRYLEYDVADPGASMQALAKVIDATLAGDRPTDSPIFRSLPRLPEANPAEVQPVPEQFREEVKRAKSAASRGWLRLLANEAMERRFWRAGAPLVAKALFDLGDFEGARRICDRVRELVPHHIDANFLLANIHERRYRDSRPLDPAHLERSDQAIQRALDGGTATLSQVAEARSLQGRNEKTRWRMAIDGATTVAERRAAAMNRALLRSFEGYRAAFRHDLNHFYPGLSAWQAGEILRSFVDSEAWNDAFDDDSPAREYRDDLSRNVPRLAAAVQLSIANALERLPADHPDRVWAEVSNADALLLAGSSRSRVVRAYLDAVPSPGGFVWNAAKGQLQLFASLGLHEEIVADVIKEVEAREAAVKPLGPQATRPLHLLVFGGHRIDGDDRPVPRFPERAVERARELLRAEFHDLHDTGHDILGFGSAAPGTDIIAHEIFRELGWPSVMCLPMTPELFVPRAFDRLDDWRERFNVLRSDRQVLELSAEDGLPGWLRDSRTDAWERGNQWVIEMARAWGAARVSCVVLWDGKPQGDASGGTAQLAELARAADDVTLRVIDAARLLD